MREQVQIHRPLVSATAPITVLLTAFFACSVHAAQPPFECPEELPHPEETLSEVPAGFNVMTNEPHPVLQLSGFYVNVGHPDVQAPVKPSRNSTKRDSKGVKTELLTWNVAGLRDAYSVCTYHRTTQTLIRSLAGYQQCTQVSSVFGDGMLNLKGASCKGTIEPRQWAAAARAKHPGGKDMLQRTVKMATHR